jgi:hypothetical protein
MSMKMGRISARWVQGTREAVATQIAARQVPINLDGFEFTAIHRNQQSLRPGSVAYAGLRVNKESG